MVDEELRRAAADLRAELSQVTPPPFRPKSELGGRVLLVAATVAVFAVGLALFVGATENTEPVDEPDPDIITEDVEPEPDEQLVDDTDDEDNQELVVETEDLERPEPGPAVIDTTHRPVTEMARPGLGEFSLEPEFQTIIAAITEVEAGGIVIPMPAGAPSWNADGSLLVLYETGELTPVHVLYDGQTFERLGPLPFFPADIEELHWDPSRSDALYYADGDDVMRYTANIDRPEDGAIDVVQTVEGCTLRTKLSQKPISADGQRMGLRCETEDGAAWLVLDTTSGEVTRVPADGPGAPQPTADGTRFVVTDEAGTLSVLDASLTPTGVTMQVETGAMSVIQTTDGRDLAVTTNFSLDGDRTGSVVGYDLATGTVVPAVGEASGFPYPPGGTNLSSSWQAQGLITATIAGIRDPDSQETLDGELLLVDFNQTAPVAYRLGHHRSHENSSFDTYRSTAWTAIDPNASRVLFSSHWDQDRVDTFVIDISELRGP